MIIIQAPTGVYMTSNNSSIGNFYINQRR